MLESIRSTIGVETIAQLGVLDETRSGSHRYRTSAAIVRYDGLFHLSLLVSCRALIGGTDHEFLYPYSRTGADDTASLRRRLREIRDGTEPLAAVHAGRPGLLTRFGLWCSRFRLDRYAGSLVLLEGPGTPRSIETFEATRGDLPFLVVEYQGSSGKSMCWCPMSAIDAVIRALDERSAAEGAAGESV